MKRNPNSIPTFLLALVLAVSLVLPVGAAGSGITLDKTSATLAVGQTLTLTATLPEGSQDAAITWASANEAIAALVPPAQGQPANTAVFRGMTAGTVTVTATAGGRTALCTITVAQDTPASVTITPAGPEFLPVGENPPAHRPGELHPGLGREPKCGLELQRPPGGHRGPQRQGDRRGRGHRHHPGGL